MVDVDLRGLLRDSSVGVYCWGYLLLGILGVGSSILKIIVVSEVIVDSDSDSSGTFSTLFNYPRLVRPSRPRQVQQ